MCFNEAGPRKAGSPAGLHARANVPRCFNEAGPRKAGSPAATRRAPPPVAPASMRPARARPEVPGTATESGSEEPELQ